MRNQAKRKPAAPRSNRESILESGYATVPPPSGAASDTDVEIDWVKVEMLRAAIEGGSYEVDPAAVAEAMIDRARRSH